jgi:hypothetical protein
MPAEIYSVTDYVYVNINIKLLDIYMKYDRILLHTHSGIFVVLCTSTFTM